MRVLRAGLSVLKGARHRALSSVQLTLAGPRGDRMFCLVDPHQRRVLKTVQHPELLCLDASFQDEVLTVQVGDQLARGVVGPSRQTIEVDYWGRQITAEVIMGPWAEVCSRFLGLPVVLARVPPGDAVYGDQVTMITTSALRSVPVVRPGVDAPELAPRFRSTFVIDDGDADADPQVWTGRTLRLGEADVVITGPVPRCAVVDVDPSTGRRDLRLLAALPTIDGQPVFGAYGVVVTPGVVSCGSAAELGAAT